MALSYTSKVILWILALVTVPTLAWTGILDGISKIQVDDAFYKAGLVYATARGINALVSLLQGTELDVLFVTMSIGEILDPLNDLIERFSDIILFAIGSLALQKLLLVMVSHKVFNAVLTGIAILSAIAMLSRKTSLYYPLLRAFVIATFIRFALGLVVLANNWVDANFLNQADSERHESMKIFQIELKQASTFANQENKFSEAVQALKVEMADLKEKIDTLDNRIYKLNQDIQTAKAELESLRKKSGTLLCSLPLMVGCPPEVEAAAANLEQLERERKKWQDDKEIFLEELEDNQNEFQCIEKLSFGESCGILDRLPKIPNASEYKDKIDSIGDRVNDFADTVMMLLTSILLKSILIPLLFLYALIKFTRYIWDFGFDE